MTELTQSDFDEQIAANVPVIVDFWAPWCGPCRSQTPILEQFAQKYAGKVKVCKVNTDVNPELCMRFGIMSIPTIMVFAEGQLKDKAIGVQSIDSLARMSGIQA